MIHQFVENNPFLSLKIGSERFIDFVKKHLAYMVANNTGGTLDALIALLTPTITAFEKWESDKDKSENTRSGKTDSLDEIVNGFETFIDDVYKEAAYKFEDDKPEVFVQFFPNGKSEYNHITRTAAAVLLKRIADLCDTHKAELKAGMSDKAKNFYNDYTNKRKEQQLEIGNVQDGSDEGITLRVNVAKKMKSVLLRLLIIHEDNEREVLKYYDAEVLNMYKRKNEKDTNTPPITPPTA